MISLHCESPGNEVFCLLSADDGSRPDIRLEMVAIPLQVRVFEDSLLRVYVPQVGSVSFRPALTPKAVDCKMTLFDSPTDDEYDGDFMEDDPESPLVRIRLRWLPEGFTKEVKISQIQVVSEGEEELEEVIEGDEEFEADFAENERKTSSVKNSLKEKSETFNEKEMKKNSPQKVGTTQKGNDMREYSKSEASQSLKSSKRNYSTFDKKSSEFQELKSQTDRSQNLDNQFIPSKDQLQETVNFLLLQLKEEKEKRQQAENELRELKGPIKKVTKQAMHPTTGLEAEIKQLKKRLSDSEVTRASLQDQLLALQANHDTKLKSAEKAIEKRSAKRIETLQKTINELGKELAQTKGQLEEVKKKDHKRDKSFTRSLNRVNRQNQEELEESRLTTEIHYGYSITDREQEDIEVPRRMDSDKTFEYTPKRPKYMEGFEFLSPELTMESEDVKINKSGGPKSPHTLHNIPLKTTAQRLTSTLEEQTELEKLKAENRTLHEHLRKLLNRPSNLSASASPNQPSKSKSPLVQRQTTKTINLEMATKDILSVNPALNIIRINDCTVQVNKRRLALVVVGDAICVKDRDKSIPVKDYVQKNWPSLK